MKLKFWGVRGSIAAPGPDTSIHGGNTSCVEITQGRHRLIIDAGTGIRPLGDHLTKLSPKPKQYHVLLSHFHFDHILGLPFFAPLYEKGNTIHLYGPKGPKKHIDKMLANLFSEEFFPVPLSAIPSVIKKHQLGNQTTTIGPFKVQSFYINHPGKTLGYLISTRSHKIVYMSDHEPIHHFNHLSKTDLSVYETKLLKTIQDSDVLIHDAFFSPSQYPNHKGWGHSSWNYAFDLAKRSNIKKCVLFHHEPNRTDAQLDKVGQSLSAKAKKLKTNIKIIVAKEKKELIV